MSFCILRLDEAKIFKKFEPLNKAEVKFYSFAADQNLSIPELDLALENTNPEKTRAHIKEIAKAVLNRWESITVENVKKNHVFKFGDTGKIVYQSNSIPDRIDWIMLVVEIDKEIRELGSHIDEILPDDRADSLATKIVDSSGFSLTSQVAPAIIISKLLLRSVTYFMKQNENDQLGLIEQSFFRALDFPDGKRQGTEVQDLTSNMWYNYTLFADDSLTVS